MKLKLHMMLVKIMSQTMAKLDNVSGLSEEQHRKANISSDDVKCIIQEYVLAVLLVQFVVGSN